MAVLRPDLIVKSTLEALFNFRCSCGGETRLLQSILGTEQLTSVITDIVPIVMAGIIGIYGLVVSVLIANDLNQKVPLYTGFIQLGAGLAVGLAGLAAGYVLWALLRFRAEKLTIYLKVLPLVLWVTLVSVEPLNSPVSTLE